MFYPNITSEIQGGILEWTSEQKEGKLVKSKQSLEFSY